MTLLTKGMGVVKNIITKSKDKAIKKIISSKRKAHIKKYGKEKEITIKDITGKKFKQVDEMIGDKEIQRYDKILRAKTWRKR
jgi:serine/threonine protein kinase HipA of HipAB toxin-antitoxin module